VELRAEPLDVLRREQVAEPDIWEWERGDLL
jgi:hypothetical protein